MIRKPDVWMGCWHPEYGWSNILVRGNKTPYSGKSGWIDKPVCLISPADLERLEKLEDWSRKIMAYWDLDSSQVDSVKVESELTDEWDAIVKGEKKH